MLKKLSIIILYFPISFFLIFPSCKVQNMKYNKEDGTETVTAMLVEKSFVKKNGERTDSKELYLRHLDEDYFIKFCESNVTIEELKKEQNKTKLILMKVRFEKWRFRYL